MSSDARPADRAAGSGAASDHGADRSTDSTTDPSTDLKTDPSTAPSTALSTDASTDPTTGGDPGERPAGFRRVVEALRERGHAHAPRWLETSARTSQEAADALGVAVGQIAKSVVFRRRADDAAVLVIASGDRRVDEKKVAALTGPIGRADAEFVKARTGFTIGGVSPLAHATPPVTLIDRELLRFDEIWAAAGHPNGVFRLEPRDLPALTGGAPVVDVVQEPRP